MKSTTTRFYCCEKYDKTRDTNNCRRNFLLYGKEKQRDAQYKTIHSLMDRRNMLYRNELPLEIVDQNIKTFNKDVQNLMNDEPKKQMQLKELETAPDIHLDDGTGNTILICGSGKRGKTHLLKKIWERYYKDDPKIITILISPSMQIPLFSDMKGVIKVREFNSATKKLIGDIKTIQFKTKNSYEFLICIDDCISVRYNNIVNELSLILRNSMISSIISLQYPMLMSKSARSSINNVMCFGLNTDEAVQAVFLFFGSALSKATGFKKDDLITEFLRLCGMADGHAFLKYRPLTRELDLCALKL